MNKRQSNTVLCCRLFEDDTECATSVRDPMPGSRCQYWFADCQVCVWSNWLSGRPTTVCTRQVQCRDVSTSQPVANSLLSHNRPLWRSTWSDWSPVCVCACLPSINERWSLACWFISTLYVSDSMGMVVSQRSKSHDEKYYFSAIDVRYEVNCTFWIARRQQTYTIIYLPLHDSLVVCRAHWS